MPKHILEKDPVNAFRGAPLDYVMGEARSAILPSGVAGAVPLMGLVIARSPRTSSRVSGEAHATAQPSPPRTPAYLAPASRVSRCRARIGSPSYSALLCPTTLTW